MSHFGKSFLSAAPPPTHAASLLCALFAFPMHVRVAAMASSTQLPSIAIQPKRKTFSYRLHTVLIPKENEKDLADIPDNVKEGLNIIPVAMVDEVLSAALVREPLPDAISSGSAEEGSAIPIAETGGGSDDITAH